MQAERLWTFVTASAASAEARLKDPSPLCQSFQNYERSVQSQLTNTAEYVTNSLASVCCPLSFFRACHASLYRKQFLLWCQNPTAHYIVRTKAEEV